MLGRQGRAGRHRRAGDADHQPGVQVHLFAAALVDPGRQVARDGLGATLASMFPAATVMDARANGKALSIYG